MEVMGTVLIEVSCRRRAKPELRTNARRLIRVIDPVGESAKRVGQEKQDEEGFFFPKTLLSPAPGVKRTGESPAICHCLIMTATET